VNTAVILAEKIDPNGVTPGVAGFAITAAVAIASIFLIIDMNSFHTRSSTSCNLSFFVVLYNFSIFTIIFS
jgi:hypothetical protein